MDELRVLNYQQIVEEVDKHFPRLEQSELSPKKIRVFSIEREEAISKQ